MISYWNIKCHLAPIEQPTDDCWIRMSAPTPDEIRSVEQTYGIPAYFFEDVSDADERARYDSEDGWQLIILRVPYAKESTSQTPFITVPMGIIFKGDILITICNYNVTMINAFVDYHRAKGTGVIDTVDFVFRMLYVASTFYLRYLREINQRIEQAKASLDENINNKSLIGLSRLQDSLTYFITSLKGNDSLLSKLKLKLPIDKLDADLIDDVNIEQNQAMETANIYSTILDSTMNTYSNVISNNVNTIMKVLTAVSIILMLPTLISSFLGMNLINGMEELWWGFPAILLLSVAVSLIGWLIFKRHKLM